MICETLNAAMLTSVRCSDVVNLGDSNLCTAVIADHIQGASTGMRGGAPASAPRTSAGSQQNSVPAAQ